jgi:hypothetical protein
VALNVAFASGSEPSVGDTLVLMTAGKVQGQFSVTVAGHQGTVSIQGGQVVLKITA